MNNWEEWKNRIIYDDKATYRITVIDVIMQKVVLQKQRWSRKHKRYMPDESVKHGIIEKDFIDLSNSFRFLPEDEAPLLRDEMKAYK